MQYLMRKWNCRNCGRSNATEVALDGSVTCDYCVAVMKIQPSQARGGETSRELSAFIRVEAKSAKSSQLNSQSAATRALHKPLPATTD